MALLLLSEVGQSRTLLWAWRGPESMPFISTLWDKQVQMRIGTSSHGNSVFMLEWESNSRKHLALTAMNTSVAWATVLQFGLVVLYLVHSCHLGISLLSRPRGSLGLSPVLNLLFPVVPCFLFFLIILFILLPISHWEKGACEVNFWNLCRSENILYPHFNWQVYNCFIDLLLPFLLLRSQKLFWFFVLCAGLFFLFKWLWNLSANFCTPRTIILLGVGLFLPTELGLNRLI